MRHLALFDLDHTPLPIDGDSANDLPLLERVDEPVATNPDARLAAVARARGWRVLHLFQ